MYARLQELGRFLTVEYELKVLQWPGKKFVMACQRGPTALIQQTQHDRKLIRSREPYASGKLRVHRP